MKLKERLNNLIKYIKTDNLYCENIRIDAETGFLS